MQPWGLKCLQQNSQFRSLGLSSTHLFMFSSSHRVIFDIFCQNESADVLLSQFDRQTHNFGGMRVSTDIRKGYLQLFKIILACRKVKPVNGCQQHWHRRRKCAQKAGELIRTLCSMAKRETAKAVWDELPPLQVGGRDLRRSQFHCYLAGWSPGDMLLSPAAIAELSASRKFKT